MSFEVTTDNIFIQKPVKTSKVKSIVSTDVIVPDTKPDAFNILQVNAIASVNEKTVMKDTVTISGNVDYTVLYTGGKDEPELNNIICQAPFTQQIPVKGVKNDMPNYVYADVTHVEFHIQNSRKINLKSVINFELSLVESKEYNAVTEINSSADVQCMKESIKHMNMTICQESKFFVEEDIYIKNFYEEEKILKIDCKINSNEIKIVNNKVIAKGSLDTDILYTCEGDVCHQESEIPFTEVIDVENIYPEVTSDIVYKLNSLQYNTEVVNEETYIRLTAEISAFIKGYSVCEYEVISDAYSPDYKFEVNQKNINLMNIREIINNTYQVKEQFSLAESSPSVVKIYNISLKPEVDDVTAYDGYLVAEGNIISNILYLTEDTNLPVYSYEASIPFSFKIKQKDTGPNDIYDINVKLENSSFVIKSDKTIEIRANVATCVKVFSEYEKQIIDFMKLYEDEPLKKDNQSGITVYFADKGEKLWDIAKKYKSTTDEITAINSLEDKYVLRERRQLIIPKRIIG